MTDNSLMNSGIRLRPVIWAATVLTLVGLIAFLWEAAGDHAGRAWQAYLINFLLFSAIAQGAFLFSTVMHLTGARWSYSMAGVAHAFAGFFPVSLVLFFLLFFGSEHLFPWLHADLHGKEAWLNLPFLFTRDAIGLMLLYGSGISYLYHCRSKSSLGSLSSLFCVLYTLTFAVVLSLLGYDLIMSLDPHWYSTLFGGYTFVKAFYVGLAGLIILASIIKRHATSTSNLQPAHFHDVGKLFFGFCLVWADFFYCQLVVIWYGNIPEESAYVILRTLSPTYQPLAWSVFIVGFIFPFFILLNRKIKTQPMVMVVLCTVVLVCIWFEHLLLVGPSLFPHETRLPIGIMDGFISLGFLGLMILSVLVFIRRFPSLVFRDCETPLAEDRRTKNRLGLTRERP